MTQVRLTTFFARFRLCSCKKFVNLFTPFHRETRHPILSCVTNIRNENKDLHSDDFSSDLVKKIDDLLIGFGRGGDLPMREEFERRRNMAVVSTAARINYLNIAETHRIVMILTALIYAFALYLISSIVVSQAISVMSAAGLNSPVSLVEWWTTGEAR